MSSAAKKRMRDTFYMNMHEDHKLSKPEVVGILKKEGVNVSTFEVTKIPEYKQAVESHLKREKLAKMIESKANPCPIPGCDGEKIETRLSGKNRWYCNKGGKRHYSVFRIATIKEKTAEKYHGADPETREKRIKKTLKDLIALLEEADEQ